MRGRRKCDENVFRHSSDRALLFSIDNVSIATNIDLTSMLACGVCPVAIVAIDVCTSAAAERVSLRASRYVQKCRCVRATRHSDVIGSQSRATSRPPRGINSESAVSSSHSGCRIDSSQTDAELIRSSHSLTFGRSISFSIIILSRLTHKNSIASSRFKLYTRLSSDV